MANREDNPLVSLLVPVRNGADTLARALDTVRAQTYKNLEIILSDNDSSDATPDLMKAFAATEPRARYVRQPKLPVLEHFSRVTQAARGKYLLFCAADDERNDVYVESMVASLERDPRAVLAFGRLVFCYPSGLRTETPHQFENDSLPRWRRVQRTVWRETHHFYGVWRTSVLQAIKVRECTYWPEMQHLMSASCRGTFIRNDDALFVYHVTPQTVKQRALYQSFRKLPFFPQRHAISTSVMAMLEAGAGVDIALWGASHMAVKEMVAVVALLRPRHRLRIVRRALRNLGANPKAVPPRQRG
jgi:glycosyltransferase involved in cell wall biosynthesis